MFEAVACSKLSDRVTWLGSTKTPAGRATLSKKQWAILAKLAGDSEYWKTSQSFMRGINGHELSSLSEKQLDWYNTIEASLNVEIDRKTTREVFGSEQPREAIKRPRQSGRLHYE